MEADRRQFTDPGDGKAEYTQLTSPLPSLSAPPPHPTGFLLIILTWLHLTRPKGKEPADVRAPGHREGKRAELGVCVVGGGASGRYIALKICSNEMRVPGRCWTVTDAQSGILWATTIININIIIIITTTLITVASIASIITSTTTDMPTCCH